MSGRVRASIEAPVPLSEEIFASVKERLEKETGKERNGTISPTLIDAFPEPLGSPERAGPRRAPELGPFPLRR